jgi:hypothetical protein
MGLGRSFKHITGRVTRIVSNQDVIQGDQKHVLTAYGKLETTLANQAGASSNRTR